jgi:hypothetical protein
MSKGPRLSKQPRVEADPVREFLGLSAYPRRSVMQRDSHFLFPLRRKSDMTSNQEEYTSHLLTERAEPSSPFMDVETPFFTPASLARAIVLASLDLQTGDAIFFHRLGKIAFVFDTHATRLTGMAHLRDSMSGGSLELCSRSPRYSAMSLEDCKCTVLSLS